MSSAVVFKPGARGRSAPGFLKLLWSACRYACVVSAPARPLITSGVIWYDIDRVRLVKQVLRLFPAFNNFIRHLPLIKWMHGRGHFNTARSERLPKKTEVTRYLFI